ncbi:hypothetical protein BOQ63_039815 [Streptomyces viridifaciens]|uniref:hypothetical protein n=1 Tax=Kitasatospora aureofaciens TaxID=1894 RepID=UPI000B02FB43|nr:hypothetical protein [Kitasatospora aureofaciens]UKZ10060.1 hypothetical protein BOQ63_039815 [Streptomyces viridifaciens]
MFLLWFMGAVRDYVGHRADRLFATLFLGGGLLSAAMPFVLAAMAERLVGAPGGTQPQLWGFDRHLALTVLVVSQAMRMALVFTRSATTVRCGLALFPRSLGRLGCLVALVPLFVVTSLPWSEPAFPAWVLAVSGQILRSSFGAPQAMAAG